MKKTFTSLALAGALVASIATPAAAQKGGNNKAEGPTLLTEQDMSWSRGASEWVNFTWTTDVELSNVEVRIEGGSSGLEVEYPSDAEFARLGVDSTLSPSEIDFSAIKLSTTTQPGAKHANIVLSWDDDKGKRQSSTTKLFLENKRYKGEDFAMVTDTVSVGTDVNAPQNNWIDLDYKGIAPTNREMALTVSGDLPVYYPQESFTSLHHDEVLHAGESDVARVWFDPELISAGSYTMTVSIDYVDANGKAKTASHDLVVTVE